MTRPSPIARTHVASGRFLMVVVALAVACQAGPEPGESTPGPQVFPDPVLSTAPLSRAEEERAVILYAQARDAMAGGRAEEARSAAAEIVDSYPSASVSGRALFLLARAALASDDAETAADAAGRFALLLARGDPRRAEARLVQAAAYDLLGEPAARLASLLAIEAGAPTNALIQGADEARAAAAALTRSELEAVLDPVPRDRPLLPVALARYAGLVYLDGDVDLARRQALTALETGARGADSLMAEGILAGRGPGFELVPERLRIGTVLPEGGSPAFQSFSRLIAEGVAVAAATYLEDAALVDVMALDDRGDPAAAAAAVTDMEADEVLGAVGFLESGTLAAAQEARTQGLPLISPTSRIAVGQGVYTLSGADPQAAAAVARYVAGEQFQRVAIIHSQAPESSEEADAFQTVLEGLGVPVVGRFDYAVGVTSFREPILEAQSSLRAAEIRALNLGPEDTLRVEMLEKVALFLPVPPEDVELLAPQVTFFGLDTLAIEVVGTSGWTDQQTLETVDTRHTTGVVASAHEGVGPNSSGYARFRDAYETHFQRTLVSPVPALGYDAALLLLEAARRGATSPARLRFELEGIRDLEGATGTFSVVGGRVVRRTHLVRIEHGALFPIG